MLLVKTYIDKSQIHGIGLFAAQEIKKGSVIWEHHLNFDIKLSEEEMESLDVVRYEFFKKYAYKEKNYYILCIDGAKYINHNSNPNTIDADGFNQTIAARDIKIGEEITSNYFDFDHESRLKLSID